MGEKRGAPMGEYLPGISSGVVSPVDAKEELYNECESLWKQMKECQSQLMLYGAEMLQKSDGKLPLLMMQMKALEAEYNEWQERNPEIISTNPDVLLAFGKEELQNVKNGLEMLLVAVQQKKKQLVEDLKREQQWHEEQEHVLDTITGIQEELKVEQCLEESTKLQEVQDKVCQLKLYKEELLNAMSEFLVKYFPLPKKGGSAKGKRYSEETAVELIALPEILMSLINKLINTPHEPYVTINEAFWPPYVELILRYGIAQRHPEDPNRIRLEAFHM